MDFSPGSWCQKVKRDGAYEIFSQRYDMLNNRKRDFIILLVIVAVLMLVPLAVGEYYLYLIRLMGIYTLLALGLNIFMGFAGQINLGSAGFFCIGAYTASILATKLGWHYLAALPVAVLFTVIVAWGMSYPLLRLRGHAMAIGTLAFSCNFSTIPDSDAEPVATMDKLY